MIIDAHCHIGEGQYKKLNAAELLRSMDACGIDKAVIVPVEEFIAVNNVKGNTLVANTVRENPERFFGFVTANPWYGQEAVNIIARFLEMGMHGIKLHPPLQGFILNDQIVHPILKVAESFRVPVYIHTGTPVQSLPLQLRDLASGFPRVNFIMGHMGAHDFNYDIVNAAEGMDNIYLESSMSLSDIIGRAIREAGAGKVLFGSNMPRSRQGYEFEKVASQCRNQEEADLVFSGNILRLMGARI
jgi:uncharacterized protein